MLRHILITSLTRSCTNVTQRESLCLSRWLCSDVSFSESLFSKQTHMCEQNQTYDRVLKIESLSNQALVGVSLKKGFVRFSICKPRGADDSLREQNNSELTCSKDSSLEVMSEKKNEGRDSKTVMFSISKPRNSELICSKDSSLEVMSENDEAGYSKSDRPLKRSARLRTIFRHATRHEILFKRWRAKLKCSRNPEARIRYRLNKMKYKEVWLITKLRELDIPKGLEETYDPEILTKEDKHFLVRTGEKKKHFVLVGRRGVFGNVILNMHQHWLRHETVKVVIRPCKPGQLEEYAEELGRLSKGIVLAKKNTNTIIFYRGKNYQQPDDMSPEDSINKYKALLKYKYMESLEFTSEFIEMLEKELKAYHSHCAKFKQEKRSRSVQQSHSAEQLEFKQRKQLEFKQRKQPHSAQLSDSAQQLEFKQRKHSDSAQQSDSAQPLEPESLILDHSISKP